MESGSALPQLRHRSATPRVVRDLRLKYRLTPTQARVATLLANRLTNAEIASELCVKPATARRHTEAVLFRLGVNSRFKVLPRIREIITQLECA